MILGLFTVSFYHFLFSRYLVLVWLVFDFCFSQFVQRCVMSGTKQSFWHSCSNHLNLEMEEERDRCRTYWLFSFTQITENVYHVFTPRSVDAGFCISSANMTSGTKRSFWFQKIWGGGWNRKNTRKKHEVLAFSFQKWSKIELY